MARIHEYIGKELLREMGINIPQGRVAGSLEEAKKIAEVMGCPVVVKAQIWVTGRKEKGGIKFANTPEEVVEAAESMFSLKIKEFEVDKVLIEEQINIKREFYAGLIIDDNSKSPVLIFSSVGGTGIEEIVQKHPDKVYKYRVNIQEGIEEHQARYICKKAGIESKLLLKLGDVIKKLYDLARKYEARSAEINPLVLTDDDKILACDCRITIDDYAVFRHPELNIEIAREFHRPPTELDKIAYNVEKNDYRGTFYFIQMNKDFNKSENFVGFHGAGGGGSMMSMDALLSNGFKIANFTDTSGNPPASKVYRAAKIILSQKNIDGYFGSGSGVASQEQFHSARGLVKAFIEEELKIPAVIRLGGNLEEKAIEILNEFSKEFPAELEAYGRDDSAEFCAGRLRKLIDEKNENEISLKKKKLSKPEKVYSFETITGKIEIDHALCKKCQSKICIDVCIPKILKLDNDKCVLAIPEEDAKKGKCIECLACELECLARGKNAVYIRLPIPGLEEYLKKN
ncbi:ATP-grasp domain-containing protein [candidate division KSB1 bacterium]